MSKIQYGPCVLNVLKTNYYKREAVFNGPDVVGTKHTLSVRAVFNPGSQADTLTGETIIGPTAPSVFPAVAFRGPPVGPHVGVPIGVPTGRAAGPSGAWTAQVVRHTLMQPRLQLRWVIDSVPILVSPLPGLVVDSYGNGPRPVSCDVVELHGSKTFLVEWVIETTLSDCWRFTQSPFIVLSHTWTSEDDLDPDFYVTRTTRGRVMFDGGLIRTPGAIIPGTINPDWYRWQFLHPVPQNMKRMGVKTRVLEDGQTVEYEILDRETALNIVSGSVTRIEGVHKVTNEIIDAIHFGETRTGGWGGDFKIGSIGGSWSRTESMSALHYYASRGRRGAFDSYPAFATHFIGLKVWGTRGSARADLESVARDIITKRILPITGLVARAVKSEITHDIVQSAIEALVVYYGGPLTQPSFLPNARDDGAYVFGSKTSNDTTANLLAASTTINKAPNGDSVGRGTFLQAIVQAALQKPCNLAATYPPPPAAVAPIPGPTLSTPPPALPAPAALPVPLPFPPTWPKPAPSTDLS